MTVLISPAPNGWQNLEFGATSPFPYSASRPHGGQDWGYYYADTRGSQRVVAPVSGVVESVYSLGGFNSGWGNRVVIRVNSRVSVALNHLATGTISVRTGQAINAGDYIGQMGATGETYGQVHLHEELWIDGTRVDPNYYRSHDLPGTEGRVSGGGAKPFPTPVFYLEGEDMANPINYYKGDKSPEIYAVYLTAGAANNDAKNQGGVYFARRYVDGIEWRVAQDAGYTIKTLPQDQFDAIPKVFGSK